MVYDTARQRTVLFGGVGGARYGDTWELSALPPTIGGPSPANQTVCAGSDVSISFTVTATPGSSPLWEEMKPDAMLWEVTFVHKLQSVTQQTYRRTLTNVQLSDGGHYRLAVTDPCGNLSYSAVSTLVVYEPPTAVVEGPERIEVCPGGAAQFQAVITEHVSPDSSLASDPSLIQWQSLDSGDELAEYVDVPGATSLTFDLSGLTSTQTGNYRAVVRNSCGSNPSNPVRLQVGPSVESEPQAPPSFVCQSTTLHVDADGVGTLRYQWRLDGIPLIESSHFAGVRTQSLTIGPLLYRHEGNYDVIVTDDCGEEFAVASRVTKLRLLPGHEWLLRSVQGPPVRSGHAMAYDSRRNLTVLFGGGQFVSSALGYYTYGDLWEWNGASWTQRTAQDPNQGWTNGTGGWKPNYTAPVARINHGLVFDSLRGRVVLFGGRARDPAGRDLFLNDTWEWDGAAWSFRGLNGPSPGELPAMAYDTRRGVTVLYSGYGNTPTGQYGLVWEWNGIGWTSIDPVSGPSRNIEWSAGNMVYDTFHQRVFYGPSVDNPGPNFWNWDGLAWTTGGAGYSQRSINRAEIPMAYDDYRRRTVSFGPGGSTWDWDGMEWESSSLMPSPPIRYGHAFAFDSMRHATVMVGGHDANDRHNTFGDTWELVAVDVPLVTVQPVNSLGNAGQTATFTAAAIGAGTLTYQCFRNGLPLTNDGRISGANTSRLSVANITGSDSGTYHAQVGNDCGTSSTLSGFLGLGQQPIEVHAKTTTSMVIVWSNPAAILEKAIDLAGPWTPVPGATSPYEVVFSGESTYFRARQP